jgi:hypothetical protein
MKDVKPDPPEVIEPEVLPPEPDPPPPGRRDPLAGIKRRLLMIFVGVLLDALDFLTMGRAGIQVGFLAGFLAAFTLFSLLQLPLKKRILFSIGAGIYCMIPMTERFPLGTILAIMFGLR